METDGNTDESGDEEIEQFNSLLTQTVHKGSAILKRLGKKVTKQTKKYIESNTKLKEDLQLQLNKKTEQQTKDGEKIQKLEETMKEQNEIISSLRQKVDDLEEKITVLEGNANPNQSGSMGNTHIQANLMAIDRLGRNGSSDQTLPEETDLFDSEQKNFVRLFMLTAEKGNEIFRKTFEDITFKFCKVSTVKEVLSLAEKHKKKITPQFVRGILWPNDDPANPVQPIESADQLDITACGALLNLKEISDLGDDSKKSLKEALEKIKFYRNKLSHMQEHKYSDDDFNTEFENIRTSFSDIAKLNPELEIPDAEIMKFKTLPITKDTFKKFYLVVREILSETNKLRDEIKRLEQSVEATKEELDKEMTNLKEEYESQIKNQKEEYERNSKVQREDFERKIREIKEEQKKMIEEQKEEYKRRLEELRNTLLKGQDTNPQEEILERMKKDLEEEQKEALKKIEEKQQSRIKKLEEEKEKKMKKQEEEQERKMMELKQEQKKKVQKLEEEQAKKIEKLEKEKEEKIKEMEEEQEMMQKQKDEHEEKIKEMEEEQEMMQKQKNEHEEKYDKRMSSLERMCEEIKQKMDIIEGSKGTTVREHALSENMDQNSVDTGQGIAQHGPDTRISDEEMRTRWEKLKSEMTTTEGLHKRVLDLEEISEKSEKLAGEIQDFLDQKIWEALRNADDIDPELELHSKCLKSMQTTKQSGNRSYCISSNVELGRFAESSKSIRWIILQGEGQSNQFHFTEKTVTFLSKILENNTCPCSLYIGKWCLWDAKCMQQILEMLKNSKMSRFKYFTFNKNACRNEEWEDLFHGLEGIKELLGIELFQCNVPQEVLPSLGEIINTNANNLFVLDLGCNESICGHFHMINDQVKTQDPLALSKLRLCSSLNVSDAKPVSKFLGKAKNLKDLNLEWCRCEVSPSVLALEQLRFLSVKHTFSKDTKKGLNVNTILSNLHKLQKLEVLDTRNCGIEDSDVQTLELGNLQNLSFIDFTGNMLSDQVMEEIEEKCNKLGIKSTFREVSNSEKQLQSLERDGLN